MTALPLIVTVSTGAVRAFEPRPDFVMGATIWRCRGRLPNKGPITRHNGATKQCGARLDEGQRFCGKCGGLIAWGGSAWYNGVALRHLEKMEIETCR